MPLKRRKLVGVVELPKGVHRVVSRGKVYFYWHPGRGTEQAGARVRLPNDPMHPDFWAELRKVQGLLTHEHVTNLAEVIDLYRQSAKFKKLAKGTRDLYERQLRIAEAGFGGMAAASLRPRHFRDVIEGLAETPGAANNLLASMRGLSRFGLVNGYFDVSLTEGISPFKQEGGHKPWTEAQLSAALAHLTGAVRRGFFLLRYTGQRGSDVVRLGETFIDDGGFRLSQHKTNREVWCPIDDALAAEIATWPRQPGPYVRQADGRPYTRKLLDTHFERQRRGIEALEGCTLHGLRSTRIVELRRWGMTTTQIQDQVGLSVAMIEHYCRFADKKANGQASVVMLREQRKVRG